MLSVNENNQFELAGTTWTILDHTEKGVVCIADVIKTMRFGSNNDWRESKIREYLNTEFLEKIEKEIGAENILLFERDLLALDGLDDYGTCTDKVSLINVDEYRKYRKKIPNTGKWWWIITPDSTPSNNDDWCIRVVSPSGRVADCNCDFVDGVRPFCIFSSLIFESGEKNGR